MSLPHSPWGCSNFLLGQTGNEPGAGQNQLQNIQTYCMRVLVLDTGEIACQNKGIWDWSKVCLVPRLLIGQLLHIKMNYCTCKNIIAHVKVNYCAYKNFTAHLKVNYCACEIDFCIFFSLFLLVIIFSTLVISHFEHVEVTRKIPSLCALKQIHGCSLKRSTQNVFQLPKDLEWLCIPGNHLCHRACMDYFLSSNTKRRLQ